MLDLNRSAFMQNPKPRLRKSGACIQLNMLNVSKTVLTVHEKRAHLMDHLVSLAKCTHKLDSIERLSCVIIHFTHCCCSSSMSKSKTAHGTRSRAHIKYFRGRIQYNLLARALINFGIEAFEEIEQFDFVHLFHFKRTCVRECDF